MNAHLKISLAFHDVRGGRLRVICYFKDISILSRTCQKLLELDVKEVSESYNDVRHGMDSGFGLILHHEEHSGLSVKEGLWNCELGNCFVHVVHLVWRKAHPRR